ncbi:MAG: putative lipid II flippase MurJ [Legionellaceae bacterium]
MSKKLLKTTSLVSLMTMISRILGFIRDTLAAQIYGASASVDAFYVAFKIPNFMRNLFAEGSFSQAFVPVLSEYKHQREKEDVKRFISHISASLSLVLLFITVIGVLGAPFIIKLFAPGYKPELPQFQMASDMLRITFPYLMLISLTALAGAILNTYGNYASPAFTPVLLNIILILAALYLSPYCKIPVEAQAWGVLAAGFIQLFFQCFYLARKGFLIRPKLNWQNEGVKRVLKLMIPALFGASIGQLSVLLNTIFASFLAIGSVSWLYYADRLAYFPLGVFGVALATVVLPHLSATHAQKSPMAFASTLDWGIRCNLLIGIPAAVTLMVLAGPLIISLFHYGQFTFHDVAMTRQSVLAYSLGLTSFMLVKVLSAAFYAIQDIKTPVRIGIISILIGIFFNFIFVNWMGQSGLALGTSLSSWVNTLLLLHLLHKRGIYQFQQGWFLFLLRLLVANTLVGFILWSLSGNIEQWLIWHWNQRLLHVFYLGIMAILAYLASLWLTGMRIRDLRIVQSMES